MERVKNRSNDAVILVSYQVPGTPGRILMDEGKYGPPGELKKVKCRVEWVDFSSHSGKSGLMQIVKGLKGNPKVLCVHGEAASCTDFASRIKKRPDWRRTRRALATVSQCRTWRVANAFTATFFYHPRR